MEITFDKRTYNIKDGDDKYEVVHIVKHPIKEYDNDTYFFYIYTECDIQSGFWYFEPSEELELRLREIIKEYENK